jgi:peptidoglycan/xylan/chitin deacetylase (PgdA/CDA1 family)
MNTAHSYHAARQKDYYGLKLLIALLILLVFLASTSFYLIQNYYSKSFFDVSTKKPLYFLQSNTLLSMYEKNNMNYAEYEKRVRYLQNIAQNNHYEIQTIYADALKDIDKNSIVVALDLMSLSDEEIQQINSFVQNGGKILFNFTSGFLDESLQYRKSNLVHAITGLQLDPEINTIKINPQSSTFLSTRLASPITQYLKEGFALNFNIYDPLPVYKAQNNLEADVYLTNWPQTNYIKLSESQELNSSQSALIWHGSKGKGKWVYFTFPTYVFLDEPQTLYANLFRGMLDYLKEIITVVPYPYIDAKNVVFVSEDTEYKYENLKQFHDVSLKHKFPVTAFCVAELAQKHAKLMQDVSQSPYLEIGSHSYTHKQIVGQSDAVYEKETIGSSKLLHTLTGKKIEGFRAAREEVDAKLIHLLENGGYTYILNKGENRLTPYFNENILIIPRHATDDYSYLINLDWSSQQILDNMIQELHTVINLDAMYTLSTHTHLMTFGSNINILDTFFAYVKKHKEMYPMNGAMIYKKINQKQHLSFTTQMTQKKIIVTLFNNNAQDVKNAHYELFVDPNIILKDVESEIIGIQTTLRRITPNKYLLVVSNLKPKSRVMLFINYAQNSH